MSTTGSIASERGTNTSSGRASGSRSRRAEAVRDHFRPEQPGRALNTEVDERARHRDLDLRRRRRVQGRLAHEPAGQRHADHVDYEPEREFRGRRAGTASTAGRRASTSAWRGADAAHDVDDVLRRASSSASSVARTVTPTGGGLRRASPSARPACSPEAPRSATAASTRSRRRSRVIRDWCRRLPSAPRSTAATKWRCCFNRDVQYSYRDGKHLLRGDRRYDDLDLSVVGPIDVRGTAGRHLMDYGRVTPAADTLAERTAVASAIASPTGRASGSTPNWSRRESEPSARTWVPEPPNIRRFELGNNV